MHTAHMQAETLIALCLIPYSLSLQWELARYGKAGGWGWRAA